MPSGPNSEIASPMSLSERELSGITQFISDPRSLTKLRNDIASAINDIADDPRNAPVRVRKLYRSMVSSVEKTQGKDRYTRSDDNLDRYFVPPILSRALQTVPEAVDFIEKCFGGFLISPPDEQYQYWTRLRKLTRDLLFLESYFSREAEDFSLKDALLCFFEKEIPSQRDKTKRAFSDGTALWCEIVTSYLSPQIHICGDYSSRSTKHNELHESFLITENGKLFGRNQVNISIKHDGSKVIFFCDISSLISYRLSSFDNISELKIKEFLQTWDSEHFKLVKSKKPFSTSFYSNILSDISFLERHDTELSIQSDDYIEDSRNNNVNRSIDERISEIDLYVIENPGRPISALIRKLFPELKDTVSSSSLGRSDVGKRPEKIPEFPAVAPVKWRDRRTVVPESEIAGEELFGFFRVV